MINGLENTNTINTIIDKAIKFKKMKHLLFGTALLISNVVEAQGGATSGPEYECNRYRLFGSEAVKKSNFAEAAMNYNIAEKYCTFDKAGYTRLIDCYRNAIGKETDPAKKKLLVDTLLTAYDRAEAKVGADDSWFLNRGYFQVTSSAPDYKKADLNLATGIQKAGTTVQDAYVITYFNNINKLYTLATVPADKEALKKRILAEYSVLSKLVVDAKLKPETQTSLAGVFNSVLKVYADFLPDLKKSMTSFPQEKEAKKAAVNSLMKIMETKKWQENKEYEMLADTLLNIEPSADAYFAKGKLMMSKKRNQDALDAFRKAKEYNPSAEAKSEMEYYTFTIYGSTGRKKEAFDLAKGLDGKYRAEGLKYRAQYVGSSVNSCGTSTFDRKCNYYYAYQLAQEAGASNLMSAYKKNFPTKTEIFKEGKKVGDSVSLSCWGVSVTIK
jgi:tetratricopeptide (TPR) repeat protein